MPKTFETVLLAHIKHTYLKKSSISPWNFRDTQYFSKGVVELNKSFTSNRAGKYRDYFNDPIMRSGYLSYFLPVNAVKAMLVLEQVSAFPKTTKIKMADIGAGPLTLTIGFIFWLTKNYPTKSFEIDVDAYELNGKILGDGIDILHTYLRESGLDKQIKVRVHAHVGNFFRGGRVGTDYDYILMGNFLNEYDERDVQQELILKILRTMSKAGTRVFMLEPGSKKISRDLQFVRDAIIENTTYRVMAPCLHQHQCPLNLTAKSDWCNFTKPWQAPQFILDFDEITMLKKQYLLYSFLFLEEGSKVQHTPQEFVAISDLMKEKGRLEIVGCGEAGRVRFIRSHRDHSENNLAFDELGRGSYFTAPDFKVHDDYELNRNASVSAADRIRRGGF